MPHGGRPRRSRAGWDVSGAWKGCVNGAGQGPAQDFWADSLLLRRPPGPPSAPRTRPLCSPNRLLRKDVQSEVRIRESLSDTFTKDMSLFLQLPINIHIKAVVIFSVKRFPEEPVQVMRLGVRHGSCVGCRGLAVGSGLGSVFVQPLVPRPPADHRALTSVRLLPVYQTFGVWLDVFLCQCL